MTTPPKSAPQDMPPECGYEPLTWQRQKLRTIFGVKTTLGLFAVASTAGFFAYKAAYRDYRREEIEMRSARNAILPLLIAERDRAFLKQLIINQQEEKELMKNVPEWEVGTYFREPVYITLQNQFIEPKYYEFMVHAEWKEANFRVVRRHFL